MASKSSEKKQKNNLRGNCYVTCEALWHLLGGKQSVWRPMRVRHEGDTHWFLAHEAIKSTKDLGQNIPQWMIENFILDPTAKQFKTSPPYNDAVGTAFLTKKPSKRAQKMMEIMLWQQVKTKEVGARK